MDLKNEVGKEHIIVRIYVSFGSIDPFHFCLISEKKKEKFKLRFVF